LVFSLNALKSAIQDTLRLRLYPECLSGDTEHTLSATSTIDIAQSFIPYSKFYRKTDPYSGTVPITLKLRRYGSPDQGIVVSLQSSSDDQPSGSTLGSHSISVGSVPTILSPYTVNVPISSMLGSNKTYWIVVEPKSSVSATDYYTIGKNTVDSDYWMGTALYRDSGGPWGSLDVDLYFDVSTPGWIYVDYPRDDLSLHSFPRLAIDILGRGFNQRWIDKRIGEYYLDLTIVCFSRFPDELDDILSYVDRALFNKRTSISGVKRIDPGRMTPVSVIRERLFSRGMRYNLVYKMTSD